MPEAGRRFVLIVIGEGQFRLVFRTVLLDGADAAQGGFAEQGLGAFVAEQEGVKVVVIDYVVDGEGSLLRGSVALGPARAISLLSSAWSR